MGQILRVFRKKASDVAYYATGANTGGRGIQIRSGRRGTAKSVTIRNELTKRNANNKKYLLDWTKSTRINVAVRACNRT